jgi:hypothetical protein
MKPRTERLIGLFVVMIIIYVIIFAVASQTDYGKKHANKLNNYLFMGFFMVIIIPYFMLSRPTAADIKYDAEHKYA